MNESDLENGFNEDLHKIVVTDGKLKNLIVNYIGEKLNPENGDITIEMVINTLAEEFPEVLLPIAEENFLRGYEVALSDVETCKREE